MKVKYKGRQGNVYQQLHDVDDRFARKWALLENHEPMCGMNNSDIREGWLLANGLEVLAKVGLQIF